MLKTQLWTSILLPPDELLKMSLSRLRNQAQLAKPTPHPALPRFEQPMMDVGHAATVQERS
jgi:hypothetical protein